MRTSTRRMLSFAVAELSSMLTRAAETSFAGRRHMQRVSHRRAALPIALAFLVFCACRETSPAATQPLASAEISGSVRDGTGAGVPGVTLRLEATGKPARQTVSATDGGFRFSGVEPGAWFLSALVPEGYFLADGEPGSRTVAVGAGTAITVPPITLQSSPTPASLDALTSTNDTGTVDTEVVPAPAIRVNDKNRHPMKGVTVTFSITGGGGTIANESAVTDSAGKATVATWRLGTHAGMNFLGASVAGLPPLVFTVKAAAGPLAGVTQVDGNAQTGLAGRALPRALALRVVDSFDNPKAGVLVSFIVSSGDGILTEATATSDSTGVARSGTWTLGSALGEQRVVARAGDKSFVFTATAIASRCEDMCPATKLAFERSGRIMAANEDGSNAIEIATGSTPSWSPDGRIVFSALDRLWMVSIEGGSPVAAANASSATDALDAYPAWSRDGSKIAFFRWAWEQSYMVVTNLSDHTENVASAWWPLGRVTWSPDGSRIAFTCEASPGDRGSDICVVASNTKGDYFNFSAWDQTGLTKVMNDGWVATDPAWSPDGTRIAFSTNRDATDGKLYVAVVNVDGSGFRRFERGHHPAWSPDGTRIVFASDVGLQVMNADGTGLRPITNNPADNSPSWRP